jgi:hypothetical protein
MRALLLVAPSIAAAAILMAACGEEESSPGPSPSPEDDQAAPADGLPMDFETIAVGQHSGVVGQQPQVLKIETQAQWEDFWARHRSLILSAPPDLPSVDFSQQMVIAAMDQQEPSGGYRFEITGIEAVEGRLTVRVTKRVPGPDCLVTAEMTQPFHIVRTAKSDLEPQLAISEETVSCG